MTLKEAVEVLNRERHDGWSHWRIVTTEEQLRASGKAGDPWVRGRTACGRTPFEVVAIAESYEQARKTMSDEETALCESCGRSLGSDHSPWCKMHGVDPPHRTPIRILYTNHRGETAWRRILPQSIVFASSEWHPEEQWLLVAYDVDRQDLRHFAMRDIREWRFEEADADTDRESQAAQHPAGPSHAGNNAKPFHPGKWGTL